MHAGEDGRRAKPGSHTRNKQQYHQVEKALACWKWRVSCTMRVPPFSPLMRMPLLRVRGPPPAPPPTPPAALAISSIWRAEQQMRQRGEGSTQKQGRLTASCSSPSPHGRAGTRLHDAPQQHCVQHSTASRPAIELAGPLCPSTSAPAVLKRTSMGCPSSCTVL